MRIKKFTGRNTNEAMKAVKREFGEDALILGNKRGGDGSREITAAIDYDTGSAPGAGTGAAAYGEQTEAPAYTRTVAPVAAADAAGAEAARTEGLEEEIRELKELCWALVNRSSGRAGMVFSRIESEMVRSGIDPHLSRKIVMNAFKAVSRKKASDLDYIRSFIRKNMRRRITVADPLSSGGVLALIGPSGVGKTTTIAKLAANEALKKKRTVALLSMDTYRIGAAEQLKRYGRIMGLPVEVAGTGRELAEQIKAHSDKDLVLVDTAGKNHDDHVHMNELSRLADLAPSVRFNLVLSSQSRDEALYDAVRGFGSVPLDSLTFTKLDEGRNHGPVVNASVLAGRPVAFLTNGQRVPEDIERATEDRLINILMPN